MSTGNLEIFAERFLQARKASGLDVAEVAKAVGVGASTVYGWQDGKYFPRRNKERLVAELLKVPLEWLLGITAKLEPPVKNQSTFQRRKVPLVSYALGGKFDVSTGHFEDLANQLEDEVETSSKDPNAFAIEVEGDSMEPEIRHGDRIVLEPNRSPANGQVVLVRLKDDRVFVKRFYRTGIEGQIIKLKSENLNYKEFEVPTTEIRFVYPACDLQRRLK